MKLLPLLSCGLLLLFGSTSQARGEENNTDGLQNELKRGRQQNSVNSPRDTSNHNIKQVRIKLRSEACDDPDKMGPKCGWAMIWVNNVDYSKHKRGHNVVVVDFLSGAYEKTAAFDTHGDRNAGDKLREFLKALPYGKIVLVAVQGDGAQYSKDAYYELKRLGGNSRHNLGASILYRQSMVLIGYTGPEDMPWVDVKKNPRRMGPTELAVFIPLVKPTKPAPTTQPPIPTLMPGGPRILIVQLHSEGCDDLRKTGSGCGQANIIVNGVDYSAHKRGHNVVIFDYVSGKYEGSFSFDTSRDIQSDDDLLDFLQHEVAKRKIVLVAVQGDGSIHDNMPAAEFEKLSGREYLLDYRGSQCIVGYSGPEEKFWRSMKTSKRFQGPTDLQVIIPLPPVKAPIKKVLNVYVRSEACYDYGLWGKSYCGWGFLVVDKKDYSLHRRGHNIAVFDYVTGKFDEAVNFDTFRDKTAGSKLSKYLLKLPARKIVLIAIQGDGSQYVKQAVPGLKRVGVKKIIMQLASSFAFVGYTGPEPVDWIKADMNRRYKGPSKVLAKIPIGFIPTIPVPTGTIPPVTGRPQYEYCGRSKFSPFVIGGVNAKPGEWPWQIGLLRNGGFVCGGTLIYDNWVVTAAHCVHRNRDARVYSVRVGDHNREFLDKEEQDIKVSHVIVYSKYNPDTLDGDIALLHLSSKVFFSKYVVPACLPPYGYMLPLLSHCFITGWGKIKHPGSSHNILQLALLPPVEERACKDRLANSPAGDDLKISENMFCAGEEGKNSSGCHGDSGGPYVCMNDNGNWVLQGVVSWGSTTCDIEENYSVFTRVSKFRRWIDYMVTTVGKQDNHIPAN